MNKIVGRYHSHRNRWLEPFHNDRGGVHILFFALFGLLMMGWLWSVSINWGMQSLVINKSKAALDRAAHAASLNIDPVAASLGKLVFSREDGAADFHKYLRLNMKLDANFQPQTGSYLTEQPIVHLFEFITLTAYPQVVSRTVKAYEGTDAQTIRTINVTIFGPTVLAIIEIRQRLIGLNRSEPILLSSAASVRFR